MNSPPIRTIYYLAEFYGLSIELLDLPANNAGYLDPHDDPQYIAVNRNLPHCEQVFTIAHELCLYISDHKSPRRRFPGRLLNGQHQSRLAKKSVRYLRFIVNKILTREREADMFAMSWLVQYGGVKYLKEFNDRHPEKIRLWMFITADAFVRMPFRIVKAIFRKLLLAPSGS